MATHNQLAHTPMSEAQVAIRSDIPPAFQRDTSIVPQTQVAYLPVIKASKRANHIEFGEQRVPAGFVVTPEGVANRRILWDGQTPVCKSSDGITGYGIAVADGDATGDCETCPFAAWTDSKPACSAMVVLAVRTLDGIPAEVVFQRTSMVDWWAVAAHIDKVGWDNAAFRVNTMPRQNAKNTWNAINLVPTAVPDAMQVVESTVRPLDDDEAGGDTNYPPFSI